TPVERRTLLLVRRLPLLAASPARRLAGLAGPSSAYRCLARLGAAGLVASLRCGARARPPPRLFHPTDLGLAAAACADGGAGAHRAGRARSPAASLLSEQPALPCLVALYELLGALAASVPGRPELLAWERPWRARARHGAAVTLPARAALAWGERTAEFL